MFEEEGGGGVRWTAPCQAFLSHGDACLPDRHVSPFATIELTQAGINGRMTHREKSSVPLVDVRGVHPVRNSDKF